MDQQIPNPIARNATNVERKSGRELIVTRHFDAPPHTVFKAWTDPALFSRWWLPEGFGITFVSCNMDVRTGGKYRLELAAGGPESMVFHGKYLEVVPDRRIVWTNDEGEPGAVTTVTFEEQDGKTLLTFSELYPSEQALDEAMTGSAAGLPAQLDQLDALLAASGR